jgi:16S rRNA pseudouridine516 synthase
MRLDKFLTEMEIGSRSQVKTYIKKGLIAVNGVVCKDSDFKLDENIDIVSYAGETLSYQKFRYYILNKPKGVVTATKDAKDKTVMDLLENVRKTDLSPVGRLDKDTEGLLLITNDGALAHALLSPKKHVDKVYRVSLAKPITKEETEQLEAGVDIGDDSITMPAKVEMVHNTEILLTIHEGRFHQVKRMLKAVGNEVVDLKRESFGCLTLEESLKSGTFRELTIEEVDKLKDLG